jgi:tetratricopeptide (TPR) repeat protein
MAQEEMLTPELSPDEIMLQQAVDAIEHEKLAEARDILTRLLKSNQNNPTIWVWLSAAMESQKERLYCLQTAYKLDPTNAAAKRGLILMGALPPDDTIQPFPMNHPRPWQDKVKVTDEKEQPKGFRRYTNNPVFRIAALVLVGLLLIGGVIGGFAISAALKPQPTRRQGPIGTPTSSPTIIPLRSATPVPPGSLQELLGGAVYTPTAIYAATPHGDAAQDAYKGAMRAYQSQQWDTVVIMMEQVATTHPGSADALFFIGESYRLSGRYEDALDAYKSAIDVNSSFAPSYLGEARTLIALNPKPKPAVVKDIENAFSEAINLDTNYAEAYMERGLYYLKQGNLLGAQMDLSQAAVINPNSPLVQVALARVELALGNNEAALEAAKLANQQDVTMLEGYLVLGMAYRANGQIDEAVKILEMYVNYEPKNAEVYTILGAAYYNDERFEDAINALNRAIQLDKTSSEAFYWRAETFMSLENYEKAQADFGQSFQYNQNSFKAGIGVARAMIKQGENGNAYAHILTIEKLAKTNEELAQLYYYRAISLEGINQQDVAYKDWKLLFEMPEGAISDELRAEAQAKVEELATPLPATPTQAATKAESTAAATRQPTKTPVPTQTRFPTATVKP